MFSVRNSGAARGLAATVAGIVMSGLAAHAASASETRGYVVSWFHMAAYNQDGDCRRRESVV